MQYTQFQAMPMAVGNHCERHDCPPGCIFSRFCLSSDQLLHTIASQIHLLVDTFRWTRWPAQAQLSSSWYWGRDLSRTVMFLENVVLLLESRLISSRHFFCGLSAHTFYMLFDQHLPPPPARLAKAAKK